MEDNQFRLGKYRHFKGNEYEALFLAQHSETREVLVVYRALYGERRIWVRPLRMWEEQVHCGNAPCARFTYIGDDEIDEKGREK